MRIYDPHTSKMLTSAEEVVRHICAKTVCLSCPLNSVVPSFRICPTYMRENIELLYNVIEQLGYENFDIREAACLDVSEYI